MPGAQIPQEGGIGDIQSIINMFGSIFGTTGNSTTDVSSPEAMQLAQLLGPLLMQMLSSGDYSPGAAERDSQGAVELIMKQALEGGVPNISGAEGSAGAYSSTTSQLLKNDLMARAGGEGAALIAKNKALYGSLRNSQSNSLISLINAISNASRRTSTSTTTPNLADNAAARRAALAAAALGAARSAMAPKPPAKPGGMSTRRKPPNYPTMPGIEEPGDLPQELQMLSPIPGDIDVDDLATGGPTPEVTVTNTDNLGEGAGVTPDLFDLGDLGQMIDGDLPDFGNEIGGPNPDITGPDVFPDEWFPDEQPAWEFQFPDNDPDWWMGGDGFEGE